MNGNNIFQQGPQGRTISVNPSGALVANDAGTGSFLVYQFGPKGFPLTVDSSGRMHVSIQSPFNTNAPVTSGAFNLGAARQFDIILTEDIVFTAFTSPGEGSRYMIVLEQDGIGSHLVTWPSNVKWRGASAPTLSTGSGTVDVITMVYRSRDNTFLSDVGINFA